MNNIIRVAPALFAYAAAQIDMLKFGAQTAGAGVFNAEFTTTANPAVFGVVTNKNEYKFKIGVTDATWNDAVTSEASANTCFWLSGNADDKKKTCYKAEITDPKGAKSIKVAMHYLKTIANTPTWTDAQGKSVYEQMTDAYAGPCEFSYT